MFRLNFFSWPCVSQVFKKSFCVATSKHYDHTAAVSPRLEAHLPTKHHPSASEQRCLSWEFTQPTSLPSSKFSALVCLCQGFTNCHPYSAIFAVAQAFLSLVRFQPHLLFWGLKKARHNKYFLKFCLGSNKKRYVRASQIMPSLFIYLQLALYCIYFT